MIRLATAAMCLLAVSAPPTIWNASPNYTNSTREVTYNIDAIVIHTTEGSDTNGDGYYSECYTQAINWFKNSSSGVSAHYVVSPAGEITNMVKDEDVAWHATYYNSRSIGIECAGFANQPGTWTPELLDALADLCAWLCQQYAVPAVHPTATAATSGGYLNSTGIVGHSQVQTSGSAAGSQYGAKSDPGPYFPWSSFIASVQAKLTPPVSAPANLSATAVLQGTTASATFSWDAVANATSGYWVDIAKSDADLQSQTGTFQNAYAGTATTLTWNNLETGTTYFWRVYAYNSSSGAHGYPSEPLTTPSPAPPPPTGGGGGGGSSGGGSSGCHAGRPDAGGAAGFALMGALTLALLALARRLGRCAP
jgi:N-acetyl-anhydromuramyl-L-alanine amidase AmpD